MLEFMQEKVRKQECQFIVNYISRLVKVHQHFAFFYEHYSLMLEGKIHGELMNYEKFESFSRRNYHHIYGWKSISGKSKRMRAAGEQTEQNIFINQE